MGESVISAGERRVSDGLLEWGGQLTHPSATAEVRFTLRHPEPERLGASIRPLALGLLPVAMRLGAPLRLEGPIDQVSLDGMAEWQEAVASWSSNGLRPVPVAAEIAPARRVPAEAAGVTAFSGGVDSCFTAVRHTEGAAAPGAAHRRAPLAAGLMVHGFDIPLEQPEVFAAAFARSQAILADLGLGALALRTDLRQLERRFELDWETQTHGIWLAAALACVEADHSHLVIPSTYPYAHQRLPWASNPLTDPLLGSEGRPLWHDGAAFDKLDKVAALAPVRTVTENLRVCWEGGQLDRNCGRCFKCVVTQVCFWVSGVARPAAFGAAASIDDVAALDLRDPYKVHLGRRLRDHAASGGDGALAGALGLALDRVGAR